MTEHVNESGSMEQEEKPVQPVVNWNMYSNPNEISFNVYKYLLQLRIERKLTNRASTLRTA